MTPALCCAELYTGSHALAPTAGLCRGLSCPRRLLTGPACPPASRPRELCSLCLRTSTGLPTHSLHAGLQCCLRGKADTDPPPLDAQQPPPRPALPTPESWSHSTRLFIFHTPFAWHVHFTHCPPASPEWRLYKNRAFCSLLHPCPQAPGSTCSVNTREAYKREGRTKWEMHLVALGIRDISGAKWLPKQVLFSVKA